MDSLRGALVELQAGAPQAVMRAMQWSMCVKDISWRASWTTSTSALGIMRARSAWAAGANGALFPATITTVGAVMARSSSSVKGSTVRSGPPGSLVHLDADDVSDPAQIGVLSEQSDVFSVSHRGDHAVDHPSRGDADPAASSVDAHGGVEVHYGVEPKEVEPQKETMQVRLPVVATRACGDLHDDRLGHCEVVAGGDQAGESLVDRTARCPVVLHPRRGVDQDHEAPAGATSTGT